MASPAAVRGSGMLPSMSASGIRRVPPLAIVIVLVAAALVATAWSTRSTTVDAFAAVRDGHALAVQQAVRADLADLGGPPTREDLDAIVREHSEDGLRYLAFLDGRGHAPLWSGSQTIERGPRLDRSGINLEHVGVRVRIEVRGTFRRAWGNGRGALWLAMEIESPQAAGLQSAATRTLAMGLIAALMLLVVAAWLVRAELRRNALDRQRERERRLATLGEMSAVLAHEIRNPLASLKGNAQLLASSLPEGEKSRAKAQRVVDEAVRLEKLTQDLLAFVRTGELARAEASPVEIVKAGIGENEVVLESGDAPATWSLDAARMREVLVNLVDNARSAGGPVEVHVGERAGRLVIEIRDHGPGVPAADRDKIFEPFFTGKTRGTGLGLAIARRIVELHRGTITVDDAPGGGALFRIEIPQ